MQITRISKNLSEAINTLEEILNNADGEALLENIKKFKQTKNPDELEIL